MRIGVFCSANNNIDPDFFTLTEELGKWMAENGHDVVYGGCDSGLMKTIGQTVHAYGGRAIGVVPRIIETGNRKADCLDVYIPTENLSDRKEVILAHSDAVIALPGGIGTLDEVFTVAAAKTIGYHRKPVILYNMKGFWNTAIALLNDLQAKGMIRGDYHEMITPADSLDELIKLLEQIK